MHSADEPEKNCGVATPVEGAISDSNSDDERLAEMGYKAELTRDFGLLSCLALGFSITNTWLAVSGALVTGISNGGAITFIWGTWLMLFIHIAVGASLGELASAYPNSGGQYYWVSQLAPQSCRRFLSYFTGVVAWAGATVTGASCCLITSQFAFGIVILFKPDFGYKPWMGFVGYQILNFLTFFLNCYSHILPYLASTSLWLSLFSFVTVTITILAVSPQKADAADIFGKGGYVNMSGWESDALNVLTGLLGVNWGFSCLDGCVHLAEEMPNPSKNIPKAIMGTVTIGFITSWIFSIAIFFVITDIEAVISTPTGVPILMVFYQALRESKVGASVLLGMLIACFVGALSTIHTWMCRLTWSFSRDNGFPLSKYLSKVAPQPFNVPFVAHVFGTFWIAVLGLLYLASTTAFNSLVTGGILMQYISYMIPVGLLMAQGRKLERKGCFWLGSRSEVKGGLLGWLANGILMLWGCFTCVIYSFPYVMPVQPGNMNYVSVVIVMIIVYAIIYWLFVGRKQFRAFDKLEAGESVPISK
ncbi:amino acid/polyamine transporter I [Kalaharituber pfeilii]|nr:amino acid/polyamine transporter I [Kalaharituber pfeilii]